MSKNVNESGSLLDGVDLECRLNNICVRSPCKSELRLGLSTLFGFFSGRFLTLLTLLLGLFIETLQFVAVLEDPLSLAVGLVISKAALIVGTVGVDPSAMNNLALLPLSVDLHARGLIEIGTGTLLLSPLPPARVDITVGVSENALSMSATVFPVAIVFSFAIVDYLANTVLEVLLPFTIILVLIVCV